MRLFLILAGPLLAASLTRSSPNEQEENHPSHHEGKTEKNGEEDASASNSSYYSTKEMRDMCLKEWTGKTEEVQQYFDQLPSEEFKENSEDIKFQHFYEKKDLWEDSNQMLNITPPPQRHLPGPEYSIEVNDTYVPKYRATTSEEDRMLEDGTFNSPSESSEEFKESSDKRVKTSKPGKRMPPPSKKKKKGKKKWPENMDPITDAVKKKKKKRIIDGEKKKKKIDLDESGKSDEDKKKKKKKRKSDPEKEKVYGDKKKKKKRSDVDKEGEKKRKKKKPDSESTESDGKNIRRKKNKSESGSDDSGGDKKKKKRSDHEYKKDGKKGPDSENKKRETDIDKKKRRENVEKELNGANRPRVKLTTINKQNVNLQGKITQLLQVRNPQNVPHPRGQTANIDFNTDNQGPLLNGKLVHSSSNTKAIQKKKSVSVFNKYLALCKLRDRHKKRSRKSQHNDFQPRPYL